MGTPEDVAAEKYFTPPEGIREKILKVIPTINWCKTCKLHQPGNYTRKDCITYSKRECAYETVILDQILALFQEEEEAELVARFINRGWIPPDEAKKYAKLADDQSLPEYYHPNYMLLGDGGRRDWDNKEIEIREAQQDMLKRGWRKVAIE